MVLLQAVPLGLVVADIDPGTAPDDDAWRDLVERIAVALAPQLGPSLSRRRG